jgi:hypothetical protein
VYCSLSLQLLWADDSAEETDETHCESGCPSGVFQEDHVQGHSCSLQSGALAPGSVYEILVEVYFVSLALHQSKCDDKHYAQIKCLPSCCLCTNLYIVHSDLSPLNIVILNRVYMFWQYYCLCDICSRNRDRSVSIVTRLQAGVQFLAKQPC